MMEDNSRIHRGVLFSYTKDAAQDFKSFYGLDLDVFMQHSVDRLLRFDPKGGFKVRLTAREDVDAITFRVQKIPVGQR